MQKNQYSLRRLFTNMTVLCVVLAIAIKFPIGTARFTTTLLLFAPCLTVAAIACWLSHNRRRTLFVVLVGGFIGFLIAPRMFVSWARPPTFWDRFLIDFRTAGIFSGCSAFVFAVLEWTVSFGSRHPTWFSSKVPQGSPSSSDDDLLYDDQNIE